MDNLYTHLHKQYAQKCKEQKVDEKDIKFRFEVGKSYLDTKYGLYISERDGKRVLVDWWYIEDDTLHKGHFSCWEWVYVDGDTETIHTGIPDGAFVRANCEIK